MFQDLGHFFFTSRSDAHFNQTESCIKGSHQSNAFISFKDEAKHMNLAWGDDKAFLETGPRQFLQSISPFVSAQCMIPKKLQKWEGLRVYPIWNQFTAFCMKIPPACPRKTASRRFLCLSAGIGMTRSSSGLWWFIVSLEAVDERNEKKPAGVFD